MRLRGEGARDVDLGQCSLVDQNVEHAGLAVQPRPRIVDLMAGQESSILENSEHIVFVMLHPGKNAAAQCSLTPVYFQLHGVGAMKLRPSCPAKPTSQLS